MAHVANHCKTQSNLSLLMHSRHYQKNYSISKSFVRFLLHITNRPCYCKSILRSASSRFSTSKYFRAKRLFLLCLSFRLKPRELIGLRQKKKVALREKFASGKPALCVFSSVLQLYLALCKIAVIPT